MQYCADKFCCLRSLLSTSWPCMVSFSLFHFFLEFKGLEEGGRS